MKRQEYLTVAVLALAAALCAPNPLWASPEGDAVQKAFDLRMSGKASEARTLLEEAISDDPRNAAAHFELGRTNLHIGLGNPRELMENFEKSAKGPVDKALSLDPQNANYAMFSADMAFMYAYMSMKMGGSDVKERVGKMCAAYERVLKIDPDWLRPMLCLVEIYGVLPEEMGGDKTKAEAYAEMVAKKNTVYGAKARSLLLPDSADRIEFWQTVLENNERDADVLEELGKACLYDEKIDEGAGYLEKAVEADPQREFLLLDLGRFHLYTVMRDDSAKETALPAAEKAIRKFLETDPDNPLRAYSVKLLSRIKGGLGEKDAMEELRKEAHALDPHHSRASGLPSLDLFVSPGEANRRHRYLFRPL